MKTKVFGFLCPTPEFAKTIGGGQYNGYVAIHRDYMTEEQDYQHWLDDMDGVMHGGCTLDRFSGECFKDSAIVPVTDISANWSEYMVFGFDILHLGDTWDYWTRERVADEVVNHVTYAKGIIEQYIER
jgi:hypothetical protein